MNHIVSVETAHINLTPKLFHEYARQYLECERAFMAAPANSPVPYFLVCRAIELELKAKHLETMSRAKAKNQFGHNLKKSYDALPPAQQTLNELEYAELVSANDIYNIPNKGFEYVSVGDAVTKLKYFPNLAVLKNIAIKLVWA